jgi:hypothetical protein
MSVNAEQFHPSIATVIRTNDCPSRPVMREELIVCPGGAVEERSLARLNATTFLE